MYQDMRLLYLEVYHMGLELVEFTGVVYLFCVVSILYFLVLSNVLVSLLNNPY